ncbi:MAG TPA: hypothetical protein VF698_04525 [Thermoanaerobaculia bacterium]|jgi:hypothetical protein
MRNPISAVLLLAVVLAAPLTYAADDGQTQPRLSVGGTNYANDYYEIVQTNGSGNVKGIRCINSVALSVKIYVNGGSAQQLDMPGSIDIDSGWIPMNVRFTSSIRVRMERPSWPTTQDSGVCTVSWALD